MKFYSSKFAVQYLAKKLKTPEEIEALNKIIEDLNYQLRDKEKDNILFAKMYLHLFEGNIQVYKDTQGVRKQLGDILRKPIDNYVKEIKEAYRHILLDRSQTSEETYKALQADVREKALREILNDYIDQEINDKKNYD